MLGRVSGNLGGVMAEKLLHITVLSLFRFASQDFPLSFLGRKQRVNMSLRSQTFLALVETDPENPLFRFSLGQALYQENNYPAAAEHLQKAAQSKADWMMPRILLGKTYLHLGQKNLAQVSLQEALNLAVAQGHEEPEIELRQLISTL
jgi:tetratricopeptide (TPR) repeat protein